MPLLSLPAEILCLIAEACNSAKDIDGLVKTCRFLHFHLIKCLYQHDAIHGRGSSVRRSAVNGNLRTLKLALDNGRYSETKPYILLEACERAVTNGKTQVVALLLQPAAERSTSQRQRDLARVVLWKATHHGHCDMIKLVLEKFPELHLDHAFDLAILYRKVSVANLLIDTAIKQQKRLFIRRKDESQQVEMPKILNSALTQRTCAEVEFIKACYSGNTERVKQLLRDGISADLEDEDGLTPLLIAVRNGNNDLVKVLLASGGLTSTLAPPSYDIAELAVIRGHIDVLRTLLERNVPYDRATTFVTAITCRSVDAVKLLDPPITEKLREGRTLLHIAAKKNFKEAVEVLLQAGAPQSTDDSGRTPMSYTENQEVLHLFRQWKASP